MCTKDGKVWHVQLLYHCAMLQLKLHESNFSLLLDRYFLTFFASFYCLQMTTSPEYQHSFRFPLNLPYQRHYKTLHIIWQLLIVNWVIICWFFSGFQFVLEYKGRKVFGKRKSFPLHRLLLYTFLHLFSISEKCTYRKVDNNTSFL